MDVTVKNKMLFTLFYQKNYLYIISVDTHIKITQRYTPEPLKTLFMVYITLVNTKISLFDQNKRKKKHFAKIIIQNSGNNVEALDSSFR